MVNILMFLKLYSVDNVCILMVPHSVRITNFDQNILHNYHAFLDSRDRDHDYVNDVESLQACYIYNKKRCKHVVR